MNKRKKSQQEMIGFVFVVVLVVIIGFVFLFISMRQSTSIVDRENFRVNNLLNGISYFTTECEKKSIQQVIISCGRGEELVCGGPCEFAEQKVSEILESSLKGDYYFTVIKKEDEQEVNLIEIQKGDCPGERTALVANSILPGKIKVKLFSCPLPEGS